MSYLLDTDVVSELRKRDKCHPNVRAWLLRNLDVAHYLSVVTLGEIRNGVERLKRKDATRAGAIERWLLQLHKEYEGSILPVNDVIADRWGRVNCPETLPTADSMIAATALEHGLTVATGNKADFVRSGVKIVNPFE